MKKALIAALLLFPLGAGATTTDATSFPSSDTLAGSSPAREFDFGRGDWPNAFFISGTGSADTETWYSTSSPYTVVEVVVGPAGDGGAGWEIDCGDKLVAKSQWPNDTYSNTALSLPQLVFLNTNVECTGDLTETTPDSFGAMVEIVPYYVNRPEDYTTIVDVGAWLGGLLIFGFMVNLLRRKK